MKIGLFFGTFNPIHVGHLIIAEVMAESTDLDEIWFIVSPHNPFKDQLKLAHAFDRYKMVELAIVDHPKFRVKDIEFHLPRPSYTVHTLAFISDKYPQHEFVLIIGEDNLHSFPKWKNSHEILKHHQLYVYPRPNTKKSELKDHHMVVWTKAPLFDISATFIRNAIRNHQSIRYMVTKDVSDYIKRKKLYI